MRVSTVVTGVLGSTVGLVAAAVAYQASSAVPAPVDTEPAASVQQSQPQSQAPEVRFDLADCTPPARLVGEECVTEVERTVVVQDTRPASVAGAASDDAFEDEQESDDAYDDDAYEDESDDAYEQESDDAYEQEDESDDAYEYEDESDEPDDEREDRADGDQSTEED